MKIPENVSCWIGFIGAMSLWGTIICGLAGLISPNEDFRNHMAWNVIYGGSLTFVSALGITVLEDEDTDG